MSPSKRVPEALFADASQDIHAIMAQLCLTEFPSTLSRSSQSLTLTAGRGHLLRKRQRDSWATGALPGRFVLEHLRAFRATGGLDSHRQGCRSRLRLRHSSAELGEDQSAAIGRIMRRA